MTPGSLHLVSLSKPCQEVLEHRARSSSQHPWVWPRTREQVNKQRFPRKQVSCGLSCGSTGGRPGPKRSLPVWRVPAKPGLRAMVELLPGMKPTRFQIPGMPDGPPGPPRVILEHLESGRGGPSPASPIILDKLPCSWTQCPGPLPVTWMCKPVP